MEIWGIHPFPTWMSLTSLPEVLKIYTFTILITTSNKNKGSDKNKSLTARESQRKSLFDDKTSKGEIEK